MKIVTPVEDLGTGEIRLQVELTVHDIATLGRLAELAIEGSHVFGRELTGQELQVKKDLKDCERRHWRALMHRKQTERGKVPTDD